MDKILIIEDSTTINKIIYKKLTELSFEAHQAFTLKSAKKLLKNNNYKLIILDLHLPDGEGIELIANIQSLSKTKVVILTSDQSNDSREELFEYGILDYIIKDKNLTYSIIEITKIIHSLEQTSKGNVLIIDDSKFICKQVKTMLEPRNYTLKSAYTARDGLDTLMQNDFDLLILDMELPDIHGIKVLELIRRHNKFLYLPIIVLSGTSTPEIIRTTLKSGANDFLKKPFIFEEFVLKVDLWIDYFKKEKTIQDKTFELEFINKNLEKIVYEEVEKNRKKDKMMFQQSRQAQMGEMISMIAHQWRQPLNAISAANSVIKQKSRINKLNPTTVSEVTSKINTYVEHLSSTIDDFRDFFKPNKDIKKTNFEVILSKTLVLIESSLKNKKITLIKDIKNTQNFMAYENELVQVVLNILKNAEDILLDTKTKNPTIEISLDKTKITIKDNGGGVPEKILNQIFDPYFSTKTKKNGTGLGLYMSKIIVEEHCNGKLDITNSKDGAIFSIELPNKVDK